MRIVKQWLLEEDEVERAHSIRFYFSDRLYITISKCPSDDTLRINSSEPMQVYPESSNQIRVKVVVA